MMRDAVLWLLSPIYFIVIECNFKEKLRKILERYLSAKIIDVKSAHGVHPGHQQNLLPPQFQIENKSRRGIFIVLFLNLL